MHNDAEQETLHAPVDRPSASGGNSVHALVRDRSAGLDVFQDTSMWVSRKFCAQMLECIERKFQPEGATS